MVFAERERDVTGFECVATSALQVGGDADDLCSGQFVLTLFLVLGEVLVWVASGIGDLIRGMVVFFASELTTVCDNAV